VSLVSRCRSIWSFAVAASIENVMIVDDAGSRAKFQNIKF